MTSFDRMAAERDRVYRMAENAPTHAVVDAEGHYGTYATVYYVGCRDTCIGRGKGRGLQVIALADAAVGDKVLAVDVRWYAARFAGE